MRRTLLVLVAIAAVVVLGAAVFVGVAAYRSTAHDVASATSTPAPAARSQLSGVVATGDLYPVYSGSPTTGHVTITAHPSTQSFVVTLTDFHGEKSVLGEPRSASLTSEAVDTSVHGPCAPGGLTFSFGRVALRSRQSFVLPGAKTGGPGAENPDYFHDLAITEVKGSDGGGCPVWLVAYAPLHWTIGDMRPDIKVVDNGAEQGANGQVVTRGGHPYSYTVVPGDNLAVIARRFNLTLQQLFYLNPARLPSPEDPVALAGEILNLSKGNR